MARDSDGPLHSPEPEGASVTSKARKHVSNESCLDAQETHRGRAVAFRRLDMPIR